PSSPPFSSPPHTGQFIIFALPAHPYERSERAGAQKQTSGELLARESSLTDHTGREWWEEEEEESSRERESSESADARRRRRTRPRRMSAPGAACRVCGGGVGECACHGGHGIGLGVGGGRCGVAVAVADLNRGFPGMWQQEEAEDQSSGVVVGGGGGGGAAAGLQEFQFFGHDEDHESVTWLFNDPAPHLQRGPAAAAAVGNGVADAAEHHRRAPPPPLFDGYAHAQYGQMPGHGLTFDVPLSRGGEVAAAAVLEAGLELGGGGNPATSGATIVSDVLLREHVH
ncbi:unnamed protein product, partial [Urochloa humidicola]